MDKFTRTRFIRDLIRQLYIYSLEMSVLSFWSLWKYFSAHILCTRERKPLNTPTVIYGATSEFSFISTFVIDAFQKILKLCGLLPIFVMDRSRWLSCLFSFSKKCFIIIVRCQGLYLKSGKLSKKGNFCFILENLENLKSWKAQIMEIWLLI